jgi:PAS domain S-box-containing protein
MSLRALNPLRDSDGTVKYVLLVAHDVTDLRQAERTARQLAAVVEGSVDFVALTDARERVHYVNPAGRVLVGLPAEGPAPVPLTTYLSEEGLWRLRDEAEPALAQTGTWRGESQLRHFPSGATIHVFMTAMILPDAPDEEAGVAFICQDLRERRRIEAALAEALRR